MIGASVFVDELAGPDIIFSPRALRQYVKLLQILCSHSFGSVMVSGWEHDKKLRMELIFLISDGMAPGLAS